jgi:hypothetical protein
MRNISNRKRQRGSGYGHVGHKLHFLDDIDDLDETEPGLVAVPDWVWELGPDCEND